MKYTYIIMTVLILCSMTTYAQIEERDLLIAVTNNSILVDIEGADTLIIPKNVSTTYQEVIEIHYNDTEVIKDLSNETILRISENLALNLYKDKVNDSDSLIKKVIERNDKLEHNLITKTAASIEQRCSYEFVVDDVVSNLTIILKDQQELEDRVTDISEDYQNAKNDLQSCSSERITLTEAKDWERKVNIILLIALFVLLFIRDGHNVLKRGKEIVHSYSGNK